MISKTFGNSLLATSLLLLSGYALADNSYQPDQQNLKQCEKIANMTPTDIFAKTQQGVGQSYDQLAQNCFKQNMCSQMDRIDKASCARSLALNSYLIDVAYQTHGPAYPPYSQTQTQQIFPATVTPATNTIPTTTATQTTPSYNNLVAPNIITTDNPTATHKSQEAIRW